MILKKLSTDGSNSEAYLLQKDQSFYCLLVSHQNLSDRLQNHEQARYIKYIPRVVSYYDGLSYLDHQISNYHKVDYKHLIKAHHFLVLEFVGESNLADVYLNLSFAERKEISYKLLNIVQQLHTKHLYHLDIKANNIVINDQNEPYLVDLGSMQQGFLRHQVNSIFSENINFDARLLSDDSYYEVFPLQRTQRFSPAKDGDYILGGSYDCYTIGCLLFDLFKTDFHQQRFDIQQLQHLIAGLIQNDQELRYDVNEALMHPFFNSENKIKQFHLKTLEKRRRQLFRRQHKIIMYFKNYYGKMEYTPDIYFDPTVPEQLTLASCKDDSCICQMDQPHFIEQEFRILFCKVNFSRQLLIQFPKLNPSSASLQYESHDLLDTEELSALQSADSIQSFHRETVSFSFSDEVDLEVE